MMVFGEGTVSVQPDQAVIMIGASTENRELRKAQAENAEIIKNVQNAVQGLGISQDQMRTSEYSIYPQYDYIDGKQQFRGYRVDHLLNITVRDTSKVGSVVDTAVTNGANTIRNIFFSLSNPSKFYQESLKEAVQDALSKAVTIASSLNVQLIKTPISINEKHETRPSATPFEPFQSVKVATTTPIEPGKLEVRSTIQAVFQYYL